MPENPYAWIDRALNTIHKANWHRQVRAIASKAGPVVELEGRSQINLASNDYLGLAGDERTIAAAVAATQKYGTGSTGSRLLTGHRSLHRQLEEAIAQWKQTEDAIVFSSGYLANFGAIAALTNPRDCILGDEYNHSSLLNGAKASGAAVYTYSHADVADLQEKLQQYRWQYRRCLILTDSVFSMDGDLCPLPEIMDLAHGYSAMVMVDEAHATGIFGDSGSGTVEYFALSDNPPIQMGTLSKALASLGGYVAGSANLIDFLRNRAPSWIYTTGLSPADTAAALEAIAIARSEPQRRETLWHNISQIKDKITEIVTPVNDRLKLLPSDSPILCLQMPDAQSVVTAGKTLQERGIFAAAVRPPTVPTSRLRLTVMATHQPQHLDSLLAAVKSIADDSSKRNL